MVGRSEGQLINLGTSQLSGGQERVVAVRGVGPVHLVLLAHHANHTDIVICSDRVYKKEGRELMSNGTATGVQTIKSYPGYFQSILLCQLA